MTSPTRISLVPGVTAFKRLFMRKISTIDISSIMMTSASIGFSSFLRKLALLSSSGAPDNSSILWIVWASQPVASVIRLAARPVGAARRISIPSPSKYLIIVLIVVVLPVPGPPVMTRSPELIACITASLCLSSSSILSAFSIRLIRSAILCLSMLSLASSAFNA